MMKGKIRLLLLLALFVSVVIGSVAFGGVKSNALLVQPDSNNTEYLNSYYNGYVKAEHFFAGQAPNASARSWYNYANPSYQAGDISQDNKTYFDYDGLHFNNIPATENGTYSSPVTFNHSNVKDNFTISSAGQGYTIQFYLGEFHHVYKPRTSTNKAEQDFFLQVQGDHIIFNGNTWAGPYTVHNSQLDIYYEINGDKGYLCVCYPRAFYGDNNAEHGYIKYEISEADLSDSLITVVMYFDTTYTGARNETANNRWIKLYVDKQKVGHNGMGGNSGVPNGFCSGSISSICVGSNDHYLRTSEFIMRSLRFYNFALTDAQIEQNYNVDAALYKGTGPIAVEAAPTAKTTPYYGITGFDKIIKQSKLGEKAGALTASSTNELFEDWEAPNWSLSQSEIYKHERYGEAWSGWAPKGDIEGRATFVDIGSSKSNASIKANTRHSNVDSYIADGNHKYDSNPKSAHDAAIYIENSFFIRSKYKCGVYDESHPFDAEKIGTEDSPKLMATCDICPTVLADFDFCGMVVDYSDDIYKKYNPEMNYSGQIWDGKTRTEDPMYTEFEKLEKDSANEGFTQTSLFPTGVGFNIVRIRDEYVQWKDLMNDNDESRQTNHKDVRIFVGGTHVSGKRQTSYLDLGIDIDSSLHNFTIYRTCERWPYNKIGNIEKGDNVYLYKFYMDKTLIAVVGMELNSGKATCYDQSGVICKIKNGAVDSSKVVTSGVCTIRDWSTNNYYGSNGAKKATNTTNDGTPSGNVLIAFHKACATFDNDPGTIFYDRSDSDTIMCTEDNMGIIVLDNIGYMDYHNQKLTQNTYNGSYTVNQDMTFTLKSSLIFSRLVFEPDIYFNRLGYDRSLEKYSDMGKTAYNAALSDPDFRASHGKAKLSSMAENASGIVMRYNGIDGVYFKDIADLITYDLVDFNGETMFTKELKAIDYFTKLYKLNKGTDAEKEALLSEMGLETVPDALKLSDNQINLMLDLIELGKAHSDYSKYWKLAGQFEGQTIGRLEDFAVVSANVPEIDTSVDIGSAYAKSLIDAKPDKITTGNNKESQAFFKSFALSIKSYVSLLIKVQVPTSWTGSMADHLKVYYASEGGTKGAAYNLVYYSADDINAYHDGEVFKHGAVTTVEPIEGTSSSYVTIEIKLSLSDFDKQFYFELKDGSTVTSACVYGLYNYCLSKWDNSDRTLREFVRRAFHIGELAQYYDGSKGTFELWKNHQ